MNATLNPPVFHFDNYVVRPVEERDRAYLCDLIQSDPLHVDCMDADFFLTLQPGEDAWSLETLDTGKVILYFKTQTAARVSLLFSGNDSKEDKTRNRLALLKGMAWIEAQLRANSFRQILFDTKGSELAAMAKRRMGFRESSGDLIRDIQPPEGIKPRVEDWHGIPQASQDGR
jgi:hypothetical protein